MAIDEGVLGGDRLTSYNKLQKELAFIERKADKRAQAEVKKQWKNINKQMKQRKSF